MFFDAFAPEIQYIGRWGKIQLTNAVKMVATATGSKFTFAFTGQMAEMRFDLWGCQQPYGHLWVQVDDGCRTEVPIDWFLRVQARDNGPHTVQVIYKSGIETHHRWYAPLVGRVTFLGVEAEGLVALPPCTKKTIEFVGDSITEGILIDAHCKTFNYSQHNLPNQNDVCATYAYLTAEALGLEPLVMGYGAGGVTKNGQGGVPKAAEAYPYCFNGMPVAYSSPDYVLINHGANDGRATAEEYVTEYKKLLELVHQMHPKAQMIVLTAFYGRYPQELGQMVAEFNKEQGTNILFIDSAGWVPREPLHPLRDGHITIANHLTAILKKELGL